MKYLLILTLSLLSSFAIADSYEENLKELFELTNVRESYASLNTLIINQMQASFFQAADQKIDANVFSEKERKQVGEVLKEQFTKMVENYEKFVKNSMPYDQVEEEIFIPLYKETYTESEVEKLIAFYKTPLGKKTIESSKQIPQQAAKMSAEKYDSKISDFVKKQVEENIEIAVEKANEIGSD